MAVSSLLRRPWAVILLLALVVFIGIQFIRPDLPQGPTTAEIDAPAPIKQILERSCFNCHSNQTKLRWFDKVAPASWLVASHVKEGREFLNFSKWDSMAPADRSAMLYLAANQIMYHTMPLPAYVALHPESKLSTEDVDVLKAYFNTTAARSHADSGQVLDPLAHEHPTDVALAPNGIAYVKGWENWKAISTTDRFDNGTLRVIYGNDIAVKAIADKHINPWPDGTTFAKVAWDQLTDSLGNIRSGNFKQVEFMIKDKQKYASTEGWGFARWRGLKLKPYGKDAFFTTECTTCHAPMKDNDFVFSIPLALTKK